MNAVEVAAAVRAGERSAVVVLDEYLERIAKRNGELNVFLHVMDDAARRDAEAVDAMVAAGVDPGPLAGVPVALKDNMCVRGEPVTCGSRILDGWRPPYDATVTERLRGAGAVIVGKTNMDEFAMGSSTENSAFGPTLNPLDPSRVPGGSSGGSAAVVAADFAPLSLGSDTGGSIRQPAAFCGTVGVKPTYGGVSRYGLVAFASSLDQIGPFASTVADAALCLDVLSGYDRRDSTSIRGGIPRVVDAVDAGVDGLRVGVISQLAGGDGGVDGIDPAVVARTREAADALRSAGAEVGDASVPATLFGLSAYYLIAPAEASSNLARYDGVRYGLRVDAESAIEMNIATRTAGFGDEVKRRIMLGTYALSAGYYDAYYGQAQRVRTLMANEFAKAYEDFDVLISPTAPWTAFELGARTADPMGMYVNDVCTIPANLTGDPAMSVPFGSGPDGLPIGVQVIAPAMGEFDMFRTAGVIEEAAP